MRRGTFAAIVFLFLLLLAALIYQLTVGGTGGTPACGPSSPNALPTKGACPSPTPTATPT
jgi:hypothetical protein